MLLHYKFHLELRVNGLRQSLSRVVVGFSMDRVLYLRKIGEIWWHYLFGHVWEGLGRFRKVWAYLT